MENLELIITDQKDFNERPLLPVNIKKRWLKDLKEGKYLKGKNYLLSYGKYCCLGVLCQLQNRPKLEIPGLKTRIRFDNSVNVISSSNPLFSVLSTNGNFQGFKVRATTFSPLMNSLTQLNDASSTFEEVIEVIEKYF